MWVEQRNGKGRGRGGRGELEVIVYLSHAVFVYCALPDRGVRGSPRLVSGSLIITRTLLVYWLFTFRYEVPRGK